MLAVIAENRSPQVPFSADYWSQSRRPFASLIFVLPLLVIYEIGVLLLPSHPVLNGADQILREFLEFLGFGQYFLLPCLTICVLLAWHHMTHEPWRIRPAVFYGMLLESILFAFGLLVTAQLLNRLFQFVMIPQRFDVAGLVCSLPMPLATTGPLASFFVKMVSYCGAGFYEEVLFRLILLPLVATLFRACKFTPLRSMILAGVVTSLAFSIAHYVGAQRYDFTLYSFTFRSLAGIFFSLLFVYRGFGIAAGTHALYDIFVASLQ